MIGKTAPRRLRAVAPEAALPRPKVKEGRLTKVTPAMLSTYFVIDDDVHMCPNDRVALNLLPMVRRDITCLLLDRDLLIFEPLI